MSGGAFVLLALLGASAAYVLHLAGERRWWGTLGTLLALAAWAALTVGLAVRGTRADHWPMTNRFEFALCWVWAILAFHLLLEHALKTRSAGAFVLPLTLLLALWAFGRPQAEQFMRPLAPALQSAWFPLHIACTALAYGAFVVGGGFGAAFLLDEWLRQRNLVPPIPNHLHCAQAQVTQSPALRAGASDPIPNTYFVWRAVGLGFPWLTLGMLTGAIWAQNAWGRYWDWDPKESWTLVVWLTYLLLLHGRALRGWRGRRVAWLAVIGVGVVGFTFFGVGWLVQTMRLESVHIF